jgi:integrase
MEYWDTHERTAMLKAALAKDKIFHVMLALSLTHGLRVTELLSLKASDVRDGSVRIVALKNGVPDTQRVFVQSGSLADCSYLFELAATCAPDEKLFKVTRRTVDRWIKDAAKIAGVHESKAHHHAMRHSLAMAMYADHQSVGEIQTVLRHRVISSSLQYLREVDKEKGLASRDRAMAAMVCS